MLRNWRICPLSSRTWRESSGNFLVRASSASATVAALQSTFGAPSVKRRKAVGISIVTDIAVKASSYKNQMSSWNLSPGRSSGRADLRVQIRLERFQPRCNGFRRWKFVSNCIGRFQTISRDAHHRGFVGLDTVLGNQLLGDPRRNSSGRLREDAFGFRKKFDGLYNLRVGNIFGPAAGFSNPLHGKRAVGRIANRQRPRDGVGFLRFESREIALHTVGNRRAARRLRAEEFHGLVFHPAERDQFLEGLSDFRNQRTAGHGNDNVVRQFPTQLFRDFVAVRLRTFGIVGPQDRKSTRLNSSHSQISYAVFCLKKTFPLLLPVMLIPF